MAVMFGDETMKRLTSYLSGRPGIVALLVFGSHARREARAGSDLDIAVLLTHEQAREGVNRSVLVTDLMNVFKRADVDVVILNNAPPLLMHRVVRDGHLLYTTDHGAVGEFTIYAIQQYADTKPLRKLQSERLERQLAEFARERRGLT